MKWFHHECAAKRSTKLEMLRKKFHAEGAGIYWGILEEIGARSETFRLKVTDISSKADERFEQLRQKCRSEGAALPAGEIEWDLIPRISAEVLADVIDTKPATLIAALKRCVEVELFDPVIWREYGVLYSRGFERRADNYTRQRNRTAAAAQAPKAFPAIAAVDKPDKSLHTVFEESAKTLPRLCENVSPEQTRQEEMRVAENSREKEDLLLLNNNKNGEELSTSDPRSMKNDSLSEEEFQIWSMEIKRTIVDWNETHRSKCDWMPSQVELRRLLTGGSAENKRRQCYQAMNLLGPDVTYPQIVCRAVRLMLEATSRKRVTNPCGWVWSALHGNGEGGVPWVQMVTAGEEARPRTREKMLGTDCFALGSVLAVTHDQ